METPRSASMRRLGQLNRQLKAKADAEPLLCSSNPLQVAAAAGAPKDTIKSFELFKVPPRWLFLRVETANGIVGWGEPNIEGYSDTVGTAVTEMMGSVIGQDPSRISYIWQKLYRQKFYGAQVASVSFSKLTRGCSRQCSLVPPSPHPTPV
jgi:hypothetical protein